MKRQSFHVIGLSILVALGVSACNKGTDANVDAGSKTQDSVSSSATASQELEFPAIPDIEIPAIIGTSPAQQQLEKSLASQFTAVDGVRVVPASCSADGAMNRAGGVTVINGGNLSHAGKDTVADVSADGSGSIVYDDGVIEVQPDGSGSIASNDGRVIEVQANGAGSYVGEGNTITLDGTGKGTWVGPERIGTIENNGDGSGTWVGPRGSITINADGSGEWTGDQGVIVNNGDGTGTRNGEAIRIKPAPRLAAAGKFLPLQKLSIPKNPCGFVIALDEKVLFDFDKSTLRPEATPDMDAVAKALSSGQFTQLGIVGHTDSKGEDAYNLSLSQRRAQAVLGALNERGAAQGATAEGMGESQPIAPNDIDGVDNPAGRQRNRRVEINVRS